MLTRLQGRRIIRVLPLLGLLAGCEEDTTGPDVSETEIWRLELEQTDDGSTLGDVAVRRGTIHLVLHLNHTSQPDPSCAGSERPLVTTFLATVEAPGSRLQPATNGSAGGSWNCHGFSAEVSLADGTTYALSSQTLPFDTLSAVTLETPMRGNPWASGVRRGYFLLAREDRFAYEPRDSHFEVLLQNRHDDEVEVALGRVQDVETWSHHDLTYSYDHFPRFDRARQIDRGESGIITVPTPSPSASGAAPPFTAYWLWTTMQVGPRPVSYGIVCILGAEYLPRTEVIVHGPEEFTCSTGWLAASALFFDPPRLFLRPEETATVALKGYGIASLSIDDAEPALRTQASYGVDENARGSGSLVITAALEAPRREHGVIARGALTPFEGEVVRTLPVEVYDLRVRPSRDTVEIVAGGSGEVGVRLVRDGLVGLDVQLSPAQLPQGLFLVPPTFSPAVTDRDSSTLALRINPSAAPGVYPLAFCATILGDPRERCHPAEVRIRVPGQTERYDLTLTTQASHDVALQGSEVFFNVLVSSLGGTVSTGVVATDRLPAGFGYVRHEANTGTYDPSTGVWTIGTVNAGPASTLRIYARAMTAGTFRNIATLTAGLAGDVNAGNDADTVEVRVVGQ